MVSMKTEIHLGAAAAGVLLIVILVAALYALTAARFQGVAGPGDPDAVAKRLEPVGEVRLLGEAPAQGAAAAGQEAAAAPAASGAAVSGEEIYNKACVVCHAAGVAGAPKLGDKAAWEPRIAQGMDTLLHTAINGKGAMPPRGTCTTCSDEDLKAAIEYMVSKAQ